MACWLISFHTSRSNRTGHLIHSAATSTIQQHRLALTEPRGLVRCGEDVEIGRRGSGIINPLAQQLASVDEIDSEPIAFVLIGKVAPMIIGPSESPPGLQRKGEEPP